MATTTLTDFLLARIAEDEVAAHAHLGNVVFGGVFSAGPVIPPARVLAECESKRRIVERCAPLHENIVTEFSDDTAPILADEVLMLLALPYADHPDYCASWRL